MSRMHILQRIGPNLYEAAIHAPVPDGTNSAGVSWSDAIVAAGLNRTSLTAGKGGTITDEKAAQIAAGTVIEGRIQWGDDVNLEHVVAADIAKSGNVQIAKGAIISRTMERKVGKDDTVAWVEEDFQRGVDANLDSLVAAGVADANSKRLDGYIAKLIEETLERLDRFGETVA